MGLHTENSMFHYPFIIVPGMFLFWFVSTRNTFMIECSCMEHYAAMEC